MGIQRLFQSMEEEKLVMKMIKLFLIRKDRLKVTSRKCLKISTKKQLVNKSLIKNMVDTKKPKMMRL